MLKAFILFLFVLDFDFRIIQNTIVKHIVL